MRVDPYDPSESIYECYDCGHRVETDRHAGTCSQCGGAVKNIAVTRE